MTAITGAAPGLTSDFTRMAYDDLPTPQELRDDCRAADATLGWAPAPRTPARPTPTIRLEELGRPSAHGLAAAAHQVADALSLEQE